MTSDFKGQFVTAFFAGGTSAAIAVTAVAPLETIKLLLQIQKGASNISSTQEYKGIIDCLIRIPREQGILSFWRGNMASVVRCFPYQALNFSLKDLFRAQFLKNSETLWDRFFSNLLAGGMAGCCALSVIYPLDYARTRMAIDIGKGDQRQFRSTTHCLMQAIRNNGLRAVYRGYFFSIFGVFIYRALYFGTYDTMIECIRPEYQHVIWIEFPAAEFSATLAGLVSYPVDTVRRQMMLQNFKPCQTSTAKAVKYLSTMDCWLKIYRAEGIKGFFHGGLTNVYRGTGGALTLVLYDNIQSWTFANHPFLSRYIPIRHHVKQNEGDSDATGFFQTIHSDKKPACKIFKDRCSFCNF